MIASELRAKLEPGMLGTYKATSVDRVLNDAENIYKRDLSKLKALELEVESKKKLIDELKCDLQVAQEELFLEKSKSTEVDQRAVFIIDKEIEIAAKVKDVERQCNERIADIGQKGNEHLQLANMKANHIIEQAQTKAQEIVDQAKLVAKQEIDMANETIKSMKDNFDSSNEMLIQKQTMLAQSIQDILQDVVSINFDSGIQADVDYIDVQYTAPKVVLPDVAQQYAQSIQQDSQEPEIVEVQEDKQELEIETPHTIKANVKKTIRPKKANYNPEEVE